MYPTDPGIILTIANLGDMLVLGFIAFIGACLIIRPGSRR